MGKAVGHILKAHDVKLEGQFHLDLAQVGTSLPTQKNIALAPPKARIVENHPEFVVVEIICSCGTKMCLKCEYADADESAG